MEEAVGPTRPAPPPTRPRGRATTRRAFRVLGRYMDEQKPRDIFFFEQDGAFVVRLLHAGHTGSRHDLAEFTETTSTRWSPRVPPSAIQDRTRPSRRRLTVARRTRDHAERTVDA